MDKKLKKKGASPKEITKSELAKKLKAIGEANNPAVVCAMIGHSRIQTHCFGYYNCARCEAQVGDALGSTYSGAEKAVIVGHDCETCRANFKTLTWRDKFMAPDPFKKKDAPKERTA